MIEAILFTLIIIFVALMLTLGIKGITEPALHVDKLRDNGAKIAPYSIKLSKEGNIIITCLTEGRIQKFNKTDFIEFKIKSEIMYNSPEINADEKESESGVEQEFEDDNLWAATFYLYTKDKNNNETLYGITEISEPNITIFMNRYEKL